MCPLVEFEDSKDKKRRQVRAIKRPDHTHKFEWQEYKDKENPCLVWGCALCDYQIKPWNCMKFLEAEKQSICWNCGKEFKLERDLTYISNPFCRECRTDLVKE